MRIEDLFSRPTSGLLPFDMETLLENHLRSVKKEEDFRSHSYDGSVIRPRHIVDLYELLREKLDNIFLANAPLVTMDGQILEMRAKSFDSFMDLISYVADLLQSQRYSVFYSLWRHTYVDPATFEVITKFAIRCWDPR